MSTSHKDRIGEYLYRTIIGNSAKNPSQITDDKHMIFQRSCQLLRELREGLRQTAVISDVYYHPTHISYACDALGCPVSKEEAHNLPPELFKKIEEASSYRPLLDYLIENKRYSDPDIVLMATSSSDHGSITVEDSEQAWNGEYQGNAHETLLNNIRLCEGKEYSNSGAIIQSSGYGKSRTVDQMATLIPTIPMNVRASEDARQGAFPPADNTLRKLLEHIKSLPYPVYALHLFFQLLFEHVYNLAQHLERKDFAANLRSALEENGRREKLYADLSGDFYNTKDLPDKFYATEANKSFEKLAGLFPETRSKKGKAAITMVIYIDEAHTLDEMTSKSKMSMFDYMLKATADLWNIPIFFLFLSTASQLEVMAGQSALSRSARFRRARLVAPFTEMPFDCHPTLIKDVIQPGLKLEDVQKFSFIVRFGRPLFWAYYDAISENKDEETAQLSTLSMAVLKLISKTEVEMPEDTGKLAVLDTLLNLEYDPRRTHSHQLASTMVASHLRTVYCVPTSRAYMHTGYPSEPVLAEAALDFINSMSNTREHAGREIMLNLYRDIDAKAAGAIDKGERGENIGKMILLRAYIAAVKQERVTVDLWSKGCSLLDFLKELTGEEYCDKVLASLPDNVAGGATLQSSFDKSWVRFTHFTRAADDSAMTSSMAWVAFIRGMAMIGWHSQQIVDVSIPILLDRDQPIEEANISAILVQFKVREVRTSPFKVAIQEKTIKFFPPPNSSRDPFPNSVKHTATGEKLRLSHRTRPYILLVMELGVLPSNKVTIPSKVVDFLDNLSKRMAKKTHVKSVKSVSNVDVLPPPTPAPETRSSHTSQSEIHPRYSLFYYGCSSKVYRCIPKEDPVITTYKSLLQLATVLIDQSPDRDIAPVLQMKPFWNAGSICFSWINEPYFKRLGNLTEDEANDEVLIGDANDFNMDLDSSNQDALEYGQTSEDMDLDM